MRHKLWVLLSAATLAGVFASYVLAAECGCCSGCGCSVGCQKVCKLVCEEKKVEVVCWGCKCEDFCVPGPSCRGSQHCETVCETCGDKESEGICVEPKAKVWYEWIPGCSAKKYTKTKLMRGVTTIKVPSHKWVLEDLCADCVARYQSPAVAPGTQLPAQPMVAENVLILPPVLK
jgi:hypothetical protein